MGRLPSGRMTLGRCTSQLARRLEETMGSVSEPLRRELLEVFGELDRPLRVAVTGRVNAGKSTLVNALLRQRIAPTDVSECTRYASRFMFGVPERVELVMSDGSRRAVGLRPDGRLPASLRDGRGHDSEARPTSDSSPDIDPDAVDRHDVDHLEVFLSNDALRRLTLVDTPGLASTREEIRPTEELLALDRRSRSALAGADALVFVLGDVLRLDDAALLTMFGRLMSGLATSAVNAVMIVTRIDQAVPATEDPIVVVRSRIESLAELLGPAVATVVPVIGLHAETSECGALTEEDLDAIRRLAELRRREPSRFELALLSVDLFERADDLGIDRRQRQRLLELLDLRGLWMLTSAVPDGLSAAELVAVLRESSGLDLVHEVLGELAANADALKASWALGGLERLAFTASSADRELLLNVVEQCELDPALHRLREIAALNELVRAGVGPGDHAQTELLGFLRSDPDVPLRRRPDDVAARAAHWRRVANDGAGDPVSRSVATVLARSYELLALEH